MVTARTAYSRELSGFLGHVSYTVAAAGPSGPSALFQATVRVDYARRRISVAVEPLAHSGQYDWVRDELQSSRFRTRLDMQTRTLDTPGWTVVGGERRDSGR